MAHQPLRLLRHLAWKGITWKAGGNGNQLGLYACMRAIIPGQPQSSCDGGKGGSRWFIMTCMAGTKFVYY